MWDDAKKGLREQVRQICKFINTDISLRIAIKTKNWDMVAALYNGKGYKALAKKLKREPYNIALAKAYLKYDKLIG